MTAEPPGRGETRRDRGHFVTRLAAAAGRSHVAGMLLRPCLPAIVGILLAVAGFFSTAPAAPPGPEAEARIAEIESYLEGIDTLEARFLQVSSEGEVARGTIYLDRPGRIRVEYEPPVPILIVGWDGTLAYVDKELEQSSFIDIDDTPLAFLLRADISLTEGVRIVDFREAEGLVRVTLVDSERPDAGSIALVFETDPLILKQWTITDAKGVSTLISLMNARQGHRLDPDLFTYSKPLPEPGGKR